MGGRPGGNTVFGRNYYSDQHQHYYQDYEESGLGLWVIWRRVKGDVDRSTFRVHL